MVEGKKPVDITIEVSSKTFSIIDPSILCDICQAIVKQICEELADEIPSDEICADICVAGAGDICLVFVETIVGYLICLSICAGLSAAAIEVATDYSCGLGGRTFMPEIKLFVKHVRIVLVIK
ncbi:MAG: halocin C8-like domain-containing protein [Metallosphaera sp.]|uniref:halocin C8-like domain-containing protein n=1 Tax=Metallosphaera TaxID=41980 RepID=UPI00064EF767|nr:halocin C8-like domain-containing protein [Metallosphaera cuprina]